MPDLSRNVSSARPGLQAGGMLEQRLIELVRTAAELMAALAAVRDINPAPCWCIGAGAVRTLVGDTLHGYRSPSPLGDVDLAYFDSSAPPERDAQLAPSLRDAMPALAWDVTNQAHVHRWFMTEFQ